MLAFSPLNIVDRLGEIVSLVRTIEAATTAEHVPDKESVDHGVNLITTLIVGELETIRDQIHPPTTGR